MANNEDPDQTNPLGAVWSGSSLFAQTYMPQHMYLQILWLNKPYTQCLVYHIWLQCHTKNIQLTFINSRNTPVPPFSHTRSTAGIECGKIWPITPRPRIRTDFPHKTSRIKARQLSQIEAPNSRRYWEVSVVRFRRRPSEFSRISWLTGCSSLLLWVTWSLK